MSDYIIATSSTADLPKEYLEEHHIPVISYTFTLDGQVYIDDCTEETKRLLFKAMREGKMPNTSQITEYAYYGSKDGNKHISCECEHCEQYKKQYKQYYQCGNDHLCPFLIG